MPTRHGAPAARILHGVLLLALPGVAGLVIIAHSWAGKASAARPAGQVIILAHPGFKAVRAPTR